MCVICIKKEPCPGGGGVGGARDRRFPLHHLCWGVFFAPSDVGEVATWRKIKETGAFLAPAGRAGGPLAGSSSVFVKDRSLE